MIKMKCAISSGLGFLNKGLLNINPYLFMALRSINKPVVNKTEQIDYLKSLKESSNPDWCKLKNSVLCKQGMLNQKNVDAVILKVMTNEKKFSSALSFANYLKSSNQELSLGAINGILNLYYEYAKENDLSNDEKEFILNTYTSLYNTYKVLDYATSEKLLHALCSVNEWKKCIKLLDDIHLTGTPSHSAYSTLIGTLFRNNKKAEALKIIQKSINSRRPLQDYAYDEWMKYIFRKYKDKKVRLKHLNEICFHTSNNCAVVTQTTARRLKESFEILNCNVQFTEIMKHSGECKSCNQKLQLLSLTEEEFSILQKNVKDKLIVGSDLFLKTSPEELKRFLDFIEETAPYDVVLDALNIAYTVGMRDINERIKLLTTVADHFLKQNKKILILGRKHMLRWQRGSLLHLMKKTQNFFTEDISQDDPYFITAAILSGSHTDIVSRDLLRGHRFLMEQDQLRRLFQRWQWQHQWMVFVPKYRPIIQAPLQFTPCAQQNDFGWHLPYEPENFSNFGKVNDGIPDCSSWLCLRSKNSS